MPLQDGARMRKHQEPIEVREQGYYEPKFFKVYNHVLDRYARRMGFQAWGVYCVLKEFADWNAQAPKCTVSQARIAITWGCTSRTVQRAIRRLRDFGLIRVKKNQASSTYTILKISVPHANFRPDKNVVSDTSQMTLQTRQERRIDQTLFTRPSLPRGGPPDRPSKGKNISPLKTGDSELEKRIKNLYEELRSMMEKAEKNGTVHLLTKNEKFKAIQNERDRLRAKLQGGMKEIG
jgi:hypothetical protein